MSRPDHQYFDLFSQITNVTFVETGTNRGGGVDEAIKSGFSKIVSIEPVDEFYNYCTEKFADEISNGRVSLHHGGSETHLPIALKEISGPVCCWLDGHYQGLDARFSVKNCPLTEEVTYLCEIRKRNPLDVILIDDVRLLTRSRAWRGHDVVFDRLIGKLLLAYQNHTLLFIEGHVKNDVLALVPNVLAKRVLDIKLRIDGRLPKEGTSSVSPLTLNSTEATSQLIAEGTDQSDTNKEVASRRYVLVKGKFGMGGRLRVLASAMHYAKKTGRRLIVDWNDGFYDDKENDRDVFSHYFKAPSSNCIDFYNSMRSAQGHIKIYPDSWAQKPFGLGETFYDETSLYRLPPPTEDVDADIVVVTGPGKFGIGIIREMFRELTLQPRIAEAVDKYIIDNFTKLPIGVHVRHGNGENGVIAPKLDWFIDKVKEIRATENRPVFLCTDSPLVQDHFISTLDRVHFTPKHYIDHGRLHNNPDNTESPYENGEQALIDMFILSRCPILVLTGHYFGQAALDFGGGSLLQCNYPEKTRFSQDAPGEPISKFKDISSKLRQAGIHIENLRCQQTDNVWTLYYGYDQIGTIGDGESIDLSAINSNLLNRRLYV